MNGAGEIILASSSPRRRELLGQLGVRFRVIATEVDERLEDGEQPVHYAERLARSKALEGWRLGGAHSPALGADTIVLLNGRILLKPDSREDAEDMLSALSGRRHEVISAVAVALAEQRVFSLVNRTGVTFAEMPQDWIERYCAGGEPMDKAGAYGVQGEAARWISHIEGSYSGVMGLPLFETACLLREAGVLE